MSLEGDADVLFLVLEQGLRRMGEEDLRAVSRRTDAGGPVNGKAGVRTVALCGLAGVNAHTDFHLRVVRPFVGDQGQLSLDRGQQRIARARKHEEEGVALRVHLVPAVSGGG